MSDNLEQKPKHPGGRPQKPFLPEYCDMLKDHMSKGYSFESFAGLIGTSKETLYAMVERNPEFLDAKRDAFELSRIFWERIAIENAVEHTVPGMGSQKLNTTAWIFNMKNRFGWTDKTEVKAESTNVNINSDVSLDHLSDDELNALEKILSKTRVINEV